MSEELTPELFEELDKVQFPAPVQESAAELAQESVRVRALAPAAMKESPAVPVQYREFAGLETE